jgi:peptidoglycan/xylan/chitin deacetylase (PgdA/CDA1 family)
VRLPAINLTFHGVGEPSRRLGRNEDEVWIGVDPFLSMLDAVAERRDLRLTFDDGNSSDLEHALPALRKRGLTGTFFVVAGRLGTPGFLDERGVEALAGAGMRIGCHGMRHRPWRRLDDRALREELVDARRLLEAVVGAPITEAACPYGSYDRRVLRALRACGYERVYTSDRGTTRPDLWLQARNTVHQGDGAGLVERIVSSDCEPLNAYRRRLKLVAKRWR